MHQEKRGKFRFVYCREWSNRKDVILQPLSAELPRLRSAAAESGLQVTDLLDRILDEQGWKALTASPSKPRRKMKVG